MTDNGLQSIILNEREQTIVNLVVRDIKTWEHDRVVPKKILVKAKPDRQEVRMKLVAQTLHDKDINISLAYQEDIDGTGFGEGEPAVMFQPIPLELVERGYPEGVSPGQKAPGLDWGGYDLGGTGGFDFADWLSGGRRPRR